MSNLKNSVKALLLLLRKGDFRYICTGLISRVYSKKETLGLKRDLNVPFKTPNAKFEISIRAIKKSDSKYFRMTHSGIGLISKNIPNCYVAVDKNDVPCFRQWLINNSENEKIQNYYRRSFPLLKPNEALLENGYIPPKMRGISIMEAGISRILDEKVNASTRYIISFVDIDNIPSLKGIKRSGFHPYILGKEKWIFFKSK